jgi:hypothetical protein
VSLEPDRCPHQTAPEIEARIATHARRHLADDDARMDRRAKASHPSPPTSGDEVLRKVDTSGSVSFAGTGYRVGNRYAGQVVGVRVVADTIQITQDACCCAPTEPVTTSSKSSARSPIPEARPRKVAQDVA